MGWGGSEMVYQVKTIAAKTDDLSLITGTCMVE